MKRRILVAVLAASMVFAVVWGAAATLDIDSSSLAANNAPVGSCDPDGVQTSYGTLFDGVDLQFEVSTVTVSGIAAACEGLTLSVTLGLGATTLATVTATIDATSETLNIPGAPAAALVDAISVSIG